MFSKNLKSDSQILPNNVSSVTKILESFDPDWPCSLNRI